MKLFTALGLMSGTSMDGIDIALIRSDGENRVVAGATCFISYSPAFRQQIKQGLQDALSITDRQQRHQRPGILTQLENRITRLHIEAVVGFLQDNALKASDIDLIGFHGQTVLHQPDKALSVQLGNGQQMADATNIAVVSDMRANDMRHGGQGAPLVPVFHRALAAALSPEITAGKPIAFINIGGISNVSWISENDEMQAFDCGPGNALIDQWVQENAGVDYDKDGDIAKSGVIIPALVERYLAHPYFDLPTPKSLDRSDFEPLQDKSISVEDGARSLARITARAIMRASEHYPALPGLMIICGGGALNPVIMEDLALLSNPSKIKVKSADALGFNTMAMEAQAFAYLAIRAKQGAALTWPGTTGCNAPVSGGVYSEPQ